MLSIMSRQALAIVLSFSTLVAAGAVKPSCYTATTTVPGIAQLCLALPPTCVEPQCLRLETATKTIPCRDPRCPVTPTATVTEPCPTCRTTCPTTTTTVSASTCTSCYTATTRVTARNCPPEPTDCIELQCIEIITDTVPCRQPGCKKTPTATSTIPCKTTCRAGCATGFETVSADCRPTPPPVY